MGEFFAHLNGSSKGCQLLKDHNRATAAVAGAALQGVGLPHAAYLAGLLHDLGKYTNRYQKYLCGETTLRRGDVIHTFQGCKFLLDAYHTETASNDEYLTAELLAIAIGSHHGLFDCIDKTHASGLDYRANKENMDYAEAITGFFTDCASKQEVERLFRLASEEIGQWCCLIDGKERDDESEFRFSLGLLARLLTSAVIEGDRADTAYYMTGIARSVFPENMRAVWKERLSYMESELRSFPCDSPIHLARRQISDICRQSAEKPEGIYRLYVPTGGGKTLSALRYALAHATKHNKRRLVFTSPLLSILEQNAAQIRKLLGDDSLILEHHSNVVQTEQTQEELDKRELLVQSWETPVIITTLVQLLNTMFDGKPTSVRRFHALCNSVIVIDEVQTVPTKLLSLFNRAIFFLSTYCHATVVLCSATQPCLEHAEHPVIADGGDIVPFDPELWAVFARTAIKPLPPFCERDIPAFVREQMEQTKSLLVVCNKKAEAARLVEQTKSAAWATFHLSAGMCMQHRRDVLTRLDETLLCPSPDSKALCIATQVIEAGVNVSFETAARFAAGMDSVVQTAGRCNRNRESEHPRPVFLINCTDEQLVQLQEIRRGKEATVELLYAFEKDPSRFFGDLSSDEAIRLYYRCLYRSMNKGAQDYVIYASDGRSNRTANRKPIGSLFDFLSQNISYTKGAEDTISAFELRQAFKTAGQAFSVFDKDTTDVLVPYGEGEKLIAELCSERAKRDPSYRASLLKRTNGFTVSLYAFQKDKLEELGALYSICDGCITVLQKAFYDDTIGVRTDNDKYAFLEA